MNDAQLTQLLCAALVEANRLDHLAKPPPSVAWSPRYRRARRRMLHDPMRWCRSRTRPVWQTALRTAAGLLLAGVVSLSAVLALSPTARAAFFTWVQEIYETHIVYRFSGAATQAPLPQLELTNLPEGYVEVERVMFTSRTSVTYENLDGKCLYFDYTHMQQGSVFDITSEDMLVSNVSINNFEGQFYKSQDINQSNALVWMDLDQNLQFVIDAFEDEATLLSCAKSIAEKNN